MYYEDAFHVSINNDVKGGYPCPYPFSRVYLNPDKQLRIRFCEFHTRDVTIGDYDHVSADDLEDIFNTNPTLISIRKDFEARDFVRCGCQEGCEWLSRYRISGGAYGSAAFLKENYMNADNTFKLKSIYLVTGSDCNIRCKYCMDDEKYDVRFGTCNVEYTNFIVDYIRSGGLVLQTGGETFLPKFGLVNKLKQLCEVGECKGSIDIFTNGTLLTEDICDLILKAPVGMIGLSMDTCRPDLFNILRKGAVFEKVLANGKMLIAKRDRMQKELPRVVILCAVTKSTALYLEETIDFFIANGFCIKPNILFQSYYAPEFTRSESLDNLSEEELAEVYRQLLRSEEKYSSDKLCSLPFKGQLLNVIEKKISGRRAQSAPGISRGARRKNTIKERINSHIKIESESNLEEAFPSDGKIHIAMSLDDRFAEMTCVSMASILKNTADDCVFHIFESRLSVIHMENFQKLGKQFSNAQWKFYHISIDDETYMTTEFTKVTKETYAKAMLPDLLPDLNRILWLDGDTVIESDIAELWNTSIEGFFVGMAPDVSGERIADKKAILEMPYEDKYYNTGVILMNLNALREIALPQMVEEVITELHSRVVEAGLNWYAEQDVLNYILQGRVKRLPLRFNCYIWQSKLDIITLDECADAIINPVVIHYIGADKPTVFTGKPFGNPHWERYFYYKKMTPYARQEDAAGYKRYRQMEKELLHTFSLPEIYGFKTRYFRIPLFRNAVRKIQALQLKKLVLWGFNDQSALLVSFLKANGILVDWIVDGLETNHGIWLFDLTVQSPDRIPDLDSSFVLLCMRSKDIADRIKTDLVLKDYSDEQIYHLYAPLCNRHEQVVIMEERT